MPVVQPKEMRVNACPEPPLSIFKSKPPNAEMLVGLKFNPTHTLRLGNWRFVRRGRSGLRLAAEK
jgi:hypothetical protein